MLVPDDHAIGHPQRHALKERPLPRSPATRSSHRSVISTDIDDEGNAPPEFRYEARERGRKVQRAQEPEVLEMLWLAERSERGPGCADAITAFRFLLAWHPGQQAGMAEGHHMGVHIPLQPRTLTVGDDIGPARARGRQDADAVRHRGAP